jgi:hypothetical protein
MVPLIPTPMNASASAAVEHRSAITLQDCTIQHLEVADTLAEPTSRGGYARH